MRILSLFLAIQLAVGAQTLPGVIGQNTTLAASAGTNLYQLGLRYGLAIEHFAFANRLPVQLTLGGSRELLIPQQRVLPANPPQHGLVVNLPERGVFLFRDGQFEKFYPVAIGQPGRFATPTGQFQLVSRVKDPTWMPPEWAGLGEDTVVPAGPDNPLGDRWMGLSSPGLGLHSTTQPASIGSAASHGCMRMYPDMARDLFDRLQVGVPVRIEYEPVKIGRDPQSGGLYLVVFPDVYGRVPLLPRAQELLARAGLGDWVSEEQLRRWVSQAEGVPKLLADGDVGLLVSGSNVSEPGLVLKSEQGCWISSEALRRMGASVQYDSVQKAVSLQYRDASCVIPAQEGVNVDGRLFFPARNLLEALGVSFRWDGPGKALTID